MAAFRIWRFRAGTRRAKGPDAARGPAPRFSGLQGGGLVRIGPRSYCFIGRWKDFQAMVADDPGASPQRDRERVGPTFPTPGFGQAHAITGAIIMPARRRLH